MRMLHTRRFAKTLREFLPADAFAFGALLLLSAARSHAVFGINWGTPATISADSDVLNTNSLLYAYTFGDTSVPSATVNGVTFASFAAANAGAGPATVGNVTLTMSSDTFHSSNTAAGSASTPFSSLPADYQGLLQSGVADNAGNAITVSLGGLSSGTTYTIEVWTNDSTGTLTSSTGNPSENDGTSIQGLNTKTLDVNSTNATGGVGQYVVGTVANFTSINFFLTASSGEKPEIAALEVRYAPEPATFGLLSLGGALLVSRRRRG